MGFLGGNAGPTSSTSSHTDIHENASVDNSTASQQIGNSGGGNVATSTLDTHGGNISLVDSSRRTGIDPTLAFNSINHITESIFGGIGRLVETGLGGHSELVNTLPVTTSGGTAGAAASPGVDVVGLLKSYGVYVLGGLAIAGLALVMILTMGKRRAK